MEGGLALDEERAARSVVVKDIPLGISVQDIEIHFQRARNGGGEVESVTMEKQSAVITFVEQKVAKRVVQKKHTLKGVVVQLLPCTQARDHLESKVFSKVTAQVEFDALPMKPGEACTIMEAMKAETNIKWHESCYAFIITGSFSEIEHAHKYLLDVVEKRDTLRLQSPKLSPNNAEDTRSKAVLNTNGNDNANSREDNLPPQEYETNEKFRIYFSNKYQERLIEMEKKFNIKIRWDRKDKVSLVPEPNCDAGKFHSANESFLDLYQSVYKNITLTRFSYDETKIDEERRMRISAICKEFAVSIGKSRNQKCFEVFGEEHVVNAALKKIADQIVRIRLESPATASGDSNSGQSRIRSAQGTRLLEKVLPGDVTISVYQGDITDERVDAIVSDANKWLPHGAGVAQAITSKGGYVIDKESRDLSTRGPVNVGDVIHTNAGSLPCKFVIHAVGPEWDKESNTKSKTLLKRVCLNSLKEAEELQVDSIALPAISSGTYGVPKEVCASVMFDAVEEYTANIAPGFKVCDVRFVNNDDATVKVFRDEFIKRYGSAQGARSCHSKLEEGRHMSNASPRSSVENENLRRNHQEHGGTPADVGSRSGQRQFEQRDARREDKGTRSISSVGGLLESTSPFYQNDPPSEYRAFATSRPLYSVSSTHGTSAPARMEVDHDKDPLTDPTSKKHEGDGTDNRDNECSICLDTMQEPNIKSLKKCKHKFCKSCIDQALEVNNRCPVCLTPCGALKGNQPPGTMKWRFQNFSLPGFERYKTILIDYNIPSGSQTGEHPNPGQRYAGARRTAYLPDSWEGREVRQLLKKAFDARLVFTVGTSATSGLHNQVTWNDIHHKTSINGGPTSFGYPDPTYLSRVKEELAAKGVK